jgi:hypothetical protein
MQVRIACGPWGFSLMPRAWLALTSVPSNLGLHLRDRVFVSGFVAACLGGNAFATLRPVETSATEVVSCYGEPAPPVRFRAPLAAFPAEVRCSWAFHDPASSAPGFSQPFDGLLLHPASSSSFIRAPPLGFQSSKSNERCSMPEPFCRSAKVYLERQSPFGKQKPWTRRGPKPTATETSIASRLLSF